MFLPQAKKLQWIVAMASTVPINLLGLQVSGDVGGITIYTDRFGKKIGFPKSPPKKAPSVEQLRVRTRFRVAQAAWSTLSDDFKFQWEKMSEVNFTGQTGQNLFIHFALIDDQRAFGTLAGIRFLDLSYPPRIRCG